MQLSLGDARLHWSVEIPGLDVLRDKVLLAEDVQSQALVVFLTTVFVLGLTSLCTTTGEKYGALKLCRNLQYQKFSDFWHLPNWSME